MVLRSFVKGWVGELKSKTSLRVFLDSKIYHFIDNLIIEDELGSTQIDHIVVSRFGIFVIETKDMDGWIFGSERSDKWTVTLYQKKVQFQNPLRQNYRHTKSLSKYLKIKHELLFPLIVFWGNSRFKTNMPDNVIRGGIKAAADYIKRFNKEIFTEDQVVELYEILQTGKHEMGLLSGFHHVQSLNERYDSDIICPKCKGKLVERHGRRGVFLGCQNYPRCNYTKDID